MIWYVQSIRHSAWQITVFSPLTVLLVRSELLLEDKLQFEKMHCSPQACVRVTSAGYRLVLWARGWPVDRIWVFLPVQVAVTSFLVSVGSLPATSNFFVVFAHRWKDAWFCFCSVQKPPRSRKGSQKHEHERDKRWVFYAHTIDSDISGV